MAQHGYNLALLEARARMQRELKLTQWLNIHQKAINLHWKKVEAFVDAHSKSSNGSIYSSISTSPSYGSCDPHQVAIHLTVRNLEGLKDPVLEQAITPFLDSDKSISNDFPNMLNRDYTFTYILADGQISVTIAAYVKEENPTCRKILVERKSVTTLQEVYKMTCDGDIVDADPVLLKVEA
jgi:hypothetical protein